MQITPPNNLLPGLMDFLKKAFNDSVMRFDEHTHILDDIDAVCRFFRTRRRTRTQRKCMWLLLFDTDETV